MAPLTQGRMTAQREGDFREEAVAAGETIYTGAIVVREADGYLAAGRVAAGLVGVGVAYADVDNSAGASGDANARFRHGCFRFGNSAGADEITIANIGDLCFIVDDQTVAATNGSNARSPAGVIEGVDAQGVWVRLDEALTKAYAA